MDNIKTILAKLQEATNIKEENEQDFTIGDIVVFKANTSFKIGKIIEITDDNLNFPILKCRHVADMSTSFNYFEEGEDATFFAPPEAVITLDELKENAQEALSRIQNAVQKLQDFNK